jgi:hypothetical protein
LRWRSGIRAFRACCGARASEISAGEGQRWIAQVMQFTVNPVGMTDETNE